MSALSVPVTAAPSFIRTELRLHVEKFPANLLSLPLIPRSRAAR